MTMTVATLWLGVLIETMIAYRFFICDRREPWELEMAEIAHISDEALMPTATIPENIVFMMPPPGGPPPPPGAPGGPPPGGPWGGSGGFGNYGGYWGGFGGYGYGGGAWGPNGLTPGGPQKGGKVAQTPKVKRSAWTRFVESLERLFS